MPPAQPNRLRQSSSDAPLHHPRSKDDISLEANNQVPCKSGSGRAPISGGNSQVSTSPPARCEEAERLDFATRWTGYTLSITNSFRQWRSVAAVAASTDQEENLCMRPVRGCLWILGLWRGFRGRWLVGWMGKIDLRGVRVGWYRWEIMRMVI